jgi:cytochrome c553
MTLAKRFVQILLIVVLVAGVFVAVMIRRGFRATAVPSVWETALARTIRNMSIPRHERRRRNSFEVSSNVLQKGRDSFLTHCASCHGIDGSGKTPVGVNLYPRVPDLSSTKTQNLSDGEIHYIIANGVQLTGMPAWGSKDPASSAESWALVLFVRSLRPLSQNELSQRASTSATAHYVGSRACEKCHQEIYTRWAKTPMANVVRDPREHPEAIIPDLATNTIARFTKEQVAFVYGSLWKQRYFAKIGDDYFPFPAQWDVGNRVWRPYMVPAKGGDWWGAVYPPDNMKRPTGPTCDGCHSVDYDIHSKQVAEWNVGCERCHGPGSEHVAHPSRGNVVNPSQMDSVAETDTCVACHSQGQPLTNPIEGKYYDWPVGYHAGLRLQDFWKLEDCTFGQTTLLLLSGLHRAQESYAGQRLCAERDVPPRDPVFLLP